MTRVQHFYDRVTTTVTCVVSDVEAGVAPIDASGRLLLKVPINAFGGAALNRFASDE